MSAENYITDRGSIRFQQIVLFGKYTIVIKSSSTNGELTRTVEARFEPDKSVPDHVAIQVQGVSASLTMANGRVLDGLWLACNQGGPIDLHGVPGDVFDEPRG
ncbi:hypothetical protein [Inquilinus sp.]|jgi:hypothetical protein|uniref:hypothetical protein n=1 Tax=Inquilinus sp. TaxID=1932117 RepID=UPI0037851FF2